MKVDPEVHFPPDRLTQFSEPPNRDLDLIGRVNQLKCTFQTSLECSKPGLGIDFGICEVIAISIPADPAVHTDLVTHFTAEQTVDRLA